VSIVFGRKLLGFVLLVVLTYAFAPGLGAQSSLDEARKRASEAAERSDEARALAAAAEQEVLDSVIAIESANGLLVAIESDLELLNRRILTAEAEVSGLLRDVQIYAVESYTDQQDAGISWIVGSTITEGAERDVFIELISGASVDSIDRYRIVTQDLDLAESEQAIQLDRQGVVLAELAVENAAMEAVFAQSQSFLDEVEAQEAIFQSEVAKLEEEERQRIEAARQKAEQERRRVAEVARQKAEQARQVKAEADRQRQEQEQKDAVDENPSEDGTTEQPAAPTTTTTPPPPPVISGGGGILCPIGGATSFTNTWGAPRSGGRSHQGTDMFAARGTPVVAPVGGTARQKSSRLGGLGFWLVGDNGVTYFGTHMDTAGASGRVEAGTVLGTIGNSGNARFTSTHLHFEIHPGGGGAVNPYSTVRAACG
jgi:peptidoglycan LD-endopeptidase LytH